MSIITRNPQADETPALRNIWKTVFGSEGETAFFNALYSTENTIVAEHDGELAAMGYIVPFGGLLRDAKEEYCAMLYSIAAHPAHRGIGLGAAVVNRLIKASYEQGYDACVLCPSQDSLFEYYSSCSKFEEWFYIAVKRITAGLAPVSDSKYLISKVSPAQYSTLRETIMQGNVHIRYSPEALEYQNLLCDELGGGLYKIGSSCAVIEVQSDKAVHIKELLKAQNDEEEGIIAAIASIFPSDNYTVRTPAKKGQGIRFGMLNAKDNIILNDNTNINTSDLLPWYGLAFD